MADQTDLSDAEARLFRAAEHGDRGSKAHLADLYLVAGLVPALVEELRMARSVVDAVREQCGPHGECDHQLCRSVRAYDQEWRAGS